MLNRRLAASLLGLALVGLPPWDARAATPSQGAGQAVTPPGFGFDRAAYTPAVLRMSVSSSGGESGTSFVNLTLIPPEGDVVGKRVEVSTPFLAGQLRNLYTQLARQDPLDLDSAEAPARQLDKLLIAPVRDDLERLGITTLLISADAGLQAIPFAALHDGRSFLGERFAFSVTPSLGLTSLAPPSAPETVPRQMAAGASRFERLAPLPLVPQEVAQVERGRGDQRFLDRSFTPEVLLEQAGNPSVKRVHVATHAEFLPGGPEKSRLYTGTGPIGLSKFAELRQRRGGAPLDLFTLSACRTALGDKESELGFAGLALQAGARSAIGTLWYVDDVATSAFFVQFYRYLDRGLPKAEALQATRIAMASGGIRMQGDRVIGPDGTTLLEGLTSNQKRRIAGGLDHPYFWSGISLLGTPW
jgi:CHAT domain-containing protein